MNVEDMDIREAGDGAATGEQVQEPPKKYTWAEVRQAVHDLRKELSSLSTMIPMAISFRKLSNGKMRVYFLRTPHNGWEITLLYCDVTPSTEFNFTKLECKPLIESNVSLGMSSGKWSREEQLLWERQRVAAWGIASYELNAATGRVIFPCASSLFVAVPISGQDDDGWQPTSLTARALVTLGGCALTPAECPTRSGLVAHGAQRDLQLAGDMLTPARLTYAARGGSTRLADDPRQAGVPSYVTQEEFSRYTGFWWQPKCNDDIFRIVYEEVDESDVKIFSFPSSQSATGETEEFRFPRAGTPNAKSILRLVTFKLQYTTPTTVLDYYQEGSPEAGCSDKTSQMLEIADIQWLDLRQSLQETFPWFEYLARVGWTPDGRFVWVQLLDRKQERLELALLPIDLFSIQFCYPHAPFRPREGSYTDLSMSEQVLITESAPNAWVNVHDILNFLKFEKIDDNYEEVTFIWASEETGHLHLYLITCRLDTNKRRRKKLIEMISDDESYAIGPNIVSKQAITTGEWEILGRKIWVDDKRKLVYFLGLRETPLERHLYVASYDPPSPDNIRLLTKVGNSYTVDIDEECSMAVVTKSNINTLPCTKVYRISHEGGNVELIAQGTLMERPKRDRGNSSDESSRSGETDSDSVDIFEQPRLIRAWEVPPAQLFEMRLSCGWMAYCTLWRTPFKGRRPTVLHVYGGPEVQTVSNCYKGIRQLRMHMLAARGFNVVSVDSRGSKHRGTAFEACIKGKLGQLELDDQVEVLQWLAKRTNCIDMDRVAIHGWSYGGYLSLLGLATRPNIFKVCCAGAPVSCWRLYDTAYTERYMSLPNQNTHNYTRASVLAHAPFMPDQEGRLLIIHGLADENVHFCHTSALLAELVRLGKPHRVQVYPGERHSLRAMHAAKHYETSLLHFLHENL